MPKMVLCLNQQEYDQVMKEVNSYSSVYLPKSKNACVRIFDDPEGNELFIICLDAAKDVTVMDMVGLIVHETVHVFQSKCANMGEDHPSSEFQAYGIQNLFLTILEAYLEKKGGSVKLCI
jgi:hypothetical protein